LSEFYPPRRVGKSKRGRTSLLSIIFTAKGFGYCYKYNSNQYYSRVLKLLITKYWPPTSNQPRSSWGWPWGPSGRSTNSREPANTWSQTWAWCRTRGRPAAVSGPFERRSSKSIRNTADPWSIRFCSGYDIWIDVNIIWRRY